MTTTNSRSLSPTEFTARVDRHKQDLVDLLNRAALDGVIFGLTSSDPLEYPPVMIAADGKVHDHVMHHIVYNVPELPDHPLSQLVDNITVKLIVARKLTSTGEKSFIIDEQEVVVAGSQPNIKLSTATEHHDSRDILRFPDEAQIIDWRQK
jgi:hypothetical protein